MSMDSINEAVMNSTNTTGDDSESGAFELLESICCIAIILISILGLIGNVTAVRYFAPKSGSRSTVNVLLTALSTFDIILLCTGAPIYSIWGITTIDKSGIAVLAIAYFMTVLYPFSNMAQMGSLLIMMLISIERWLGVCHPFLARRKLTVRKVRICVVMVAVFTIVYNAVRFWEYAVDDEGLLQPYLRENPIYLTIYVHWMYFAFVFCLPFIVILVFNGLVAIGVRRAMLNRPRCQLNVQQRRERKTTLMLLVVVAVFLLCNSLSWPLNAFETFHNNTALKSDALDFLSDLNNLLVLSHPTLNIFVYMYFSTAFRRKFFSQLFRFWPWKKLSRGPNGDEMNRHLDYSAASDYYSPMISRKWRPSTSNCLLSVPACHTRNHRNSSSAILMENEHSKNGFGASVAPLKHHLDVSEANFRSKSSVDLRLPNEKALVSVNLIVPTSALMPDSL